MKLIAVLSPERVEERAHVSVNLAAEAAILGQRTLMIDLDPSCSSTAQLFREVRSSTPTVRTLLESDAAVPSCARTLRIAVRSWKYLLRRYNLFVIAGEPRLVGREREEAGRALRKIRDRCDGEFDLLVLDSPGLEDPLGSAAAEIAERVVFVERAGPLIDNEIRRFAKAAREHGIETARLRHLVVASAVNDRLSQIARESLARLIERESRGEDSVGRILETQVRHDVAIVARQGLEVRRRGDWVDLVREVLSEFEGQEDATGSRNA